MRHHRQDAFLPSAKDTPIRTEKAYLHMLRGFAVALNGDFHDCMSAICPNASAYRRATVKRWQRMEAQRLGDHRYCKAPRPAEVLDVLRTSITFNTPQEVRGAFKRFARDFEVVGMDNSFSRELGPIRAWGLRAIRLYVVFEPPLSLGVIARRVLDHPDKEDYPGLVPNDHKVHVMKATRYFRSVVQSEERVRIVVEVQLMYSPYLIDGIKQAYFLEQILAATAPSSAPG